MDEYFKTIVLVCIILLLLYKLGTRNFNYWHEKGVKQLKPVPFLGDSFGSMFRLRNSLEAMKAFYDPFKDCRFGGIYQGQTPSLSVTDPELLKLILVKDAEYFVNRQELFSTSDTLFDKNLFNLNGEAWRKMRTVMTTVFTSSKMKDMFTFMNVSAEQTVKHLEEQFKKHKLKNPGAKFMEIDQKDFYSRYGTDVIATTAFGLEVNSFKNPENEFYTIGYSIKNAFNGLNSIKVMIIFVLPNLAKFLGLKFLGDSYNKRFTSLISETVKTREEKNIIRKDVIHTLMEARKGRGLDESGELIKGKLPELTDEDIAAQCLNFFFGGFDTMATLLAFTTYELAIQPDIQKKLQEEIDDVMEKENKITYDAVMNRMEYLNMVINETLRKWPPAGMANRKVGKKYVIPKTDKSPEVVLNQGDNIFISITGLHYDPEYFPEPEKFDPERFRDEKNNIKPFTFLPFGEGLRHCIAKRYALMEAKIILVHVLRKFTFLPSKKTDIPLKLSKKVAFAIAPVNGFWIGVKPRN